MSEGEGNSEFGRRNSGEPPPAAPSDFRLPTSEFVQPPVPRPQSPSSFPLPPSALPLGRIGGVDYGTVRIGVAISDPGRQIASPLENYTRRTGGAGRPALRGVGGPRADRPMGRGPAGASRRPREREVAGGPPLGPVARRGDGRAGGVLRRALHHQRGRATPLRRRPDQQTTQEAFGHAGRPDHARAYLQSQTKGQEPPGPLDG